MESFFSSMKREELYRGKYRSERELRAAIDKYIQFYNTERPHETLRYKTPQQKEDEFACVRRRESACTTTCGQHALSRRRTQCFTATRAVTIEPERL